VFWVPFELDPADAPDLGLVVIDAIRATTSISTALAAGAARVIPVQTPADALERAKALPEALACGERNGLPPDGFDLGNSPREYSRERVAGRTLVFTTSNGTAAMARAARGRALRLACFRNLGAVARAVAGAVERGDEPPGIGIVCAGRQGRVSMDDAWCAGHLVDRLVRVLPEIRLADGARAARALADRLGPPRADGLAETEAGRALRGVGLEADLDLCARLDDLAVVPGWRSGAFVAGGEEE
jgi:2-phosphosulfolactate phosphatase